MIKSSEVEQSFYKPAVLLKYLLTIVIFLFILSVWKPYTAWAGTYDERLAIQEQKKQELIRATDNLEKDITLVLPYYSSFEQIYKSMNTEPLSTYRYESTQSTFNSDKTYKINGTYTYEHAVIAAYKTPALESKIDSKQLETLKKAKAIISQIIKPEMNDYQKELAIHDYIVLNCAYDTVEGDAFNNPTYVSQSDSHNAYGALIKNLAVCDGYAEAGKILLTMAGIESYILKSDTHAWNLVKIEDAYYHIDFTWNDPTPDVKGKVEYNIFNLTDEQTIVIEQHSWENREKYPKATATKYNYYVYNNLIADSEAKLQSLIIQQINQNQKKITVGLSEDLIKEMNFYPDQLLSFLFNYTSSYRYNEPISTMPYLTIILP